MFEGLGNIASLFTQLPKIKAEMAQLKQRLEQIVVEGTAGGGMVRARVSGTLELLECRLSDEAMNLGDKEMLEDLIRAGINQGMEKARQQAAEEARKSCHELGLAGRLQSAQLLRRIIVMATMLNANAGAIDQLMRELCKLPGIGPKSADRLTHYLLANGRDRALALAGALQLVAERVRPCTQCFNLTEQGLCSICSDPRRDATIICVVEQPRDLAALERSGSFRGQYHVLQGRLAPLENMGPEQLTLDALMARIRAQGVQEVVLATNPTLEGDGTALYISSLMGNSNVRVTRLARGLPSGSGLEFANSQMLADALEGRRAF